MPDELHSWYCHQCLAETPIRNGRSDVVRRSLFAEKTIEQMTGHMIGAHGEKPPKGWAEAKRAEKNKAKSKRKKDKKRKKKRRGK